MPSNPLQLNEATSAGSVRVDAWVGHWVLCSESMPDPETQVIVRTQKGNVFTAQYFPDVEDDEKWRLDVDCLCPWTSEVVKWMALPE